MKNFIHDDIEFIVGENASDNWNILDISEQNWIWFHLDNYSSPYVVMKISLNKLKKNKNNWKSFLNYGAILCKENSKYSNKKVNVIWTIIKNLTKGKVIGEVFIKGKISTIMC